MEFAYNLFPISDDFVYLTKRIEELLEKTNENDISLIKFLKEKKDMVERKLKAEECFINRINFLWKKKLLKYLEKEKLNLLKINFYII